MFGFATTRRPAQSGRSVRFKLGLEELSPRLTPSGLGLPPTPPPLLLAAQPPVTPPAQLGPVIDTFDASEVGHALWKITGHVTAASPAGLVVSFEGIPALQGKSAVCDADGNFVLVFTVQTNGTDTGTVSAQTVDANGRHSNLALVYIDPT